MRGRPAKPKSIVNLGIGEYPSATKINVLEAELKNLNAVKPLKASDFKKLLAKLIPAMGSYLSVKEARLSAQPRTRGNKNKTHIQVLFFDCANAWSEITGTEPSIWEKDRDESTGAPESTSVSLAKAIIKTVDGKNSVQSFRAQTKRARQIR